MSESTLEDLPLQTASLTLRPLATHDAAALLLLSNESAFREGLPSQVYADETEATAALEFLIGQYATPANPRLGPYVLAIDHRADSSLIGHVGFSPFDQDVEIGFAIAEDYQRRGLGTEAVMAASRWALDRFGLGRIVAITAHRNDASRRLLARAGFAYEGARTMHFQGSPQRVAIYHVSR